MLLLVGFIALIKGADLLVEGASSLARRLKVPDLVIGLTLVSFGTSVAELFVNISASIQDNNGIIVGNILGSNIFNGAVILGVSAIIYPLKVTDNTVWKEIPLSLLAAIVFIVLANDQILDGAPLSQLSRIDGMILLLFFVVFIHYTISLARQHRRLFEQQSVYQDAVPKSLMLIAVGLLALVVGGKWVVSGAVSLAKMWHISEKLISLTIVAAGTSLPELATSAIAAYKKKPDIAVANIVGSNIFNIFFILGVSAQISPVRYDTVFNIDAGMCILVSLLMFLFMFTFKRKKFDRAEGVFLLFLYLGYLSFLIYRG
ncbi:MAG: calcium/sodium antiporter [Candidatus Omnitrophica bacterium]|nr:calcium/sodium antiporter [Candidatus Omnitrophota bacterium]